MSTPEKTTNDLFPSTYLKASDLVNGDFTVTIQSLKKELMAITKELKPVLHFVEPIKPLVLNKTNCTSIEQLYGNVLAAWPGKQITLFPTMVRFMDKEVMSIRIRDNVPPAEDAPIVAPVTQRKAPRQDAILAEMGYTPETPVNWENT
jgi:hypothetical protein